MKRSFLLFSALVLSTLVQSQTMSSRDSAMVKSIFEEVLGNGECHENLHYLCKDIGHRLSGSPSLGEAISWGEELLRSYGADHVYLQDVQVPKWVRGEKESAGMTVNGQREMLHITALGGSVGSDGKITAEVIEVKYLEDLDTIPRSVVEGKIVLFNRPMDPLLINTGMAYGGAFDQRSNGASKAAEKGAVAALVRSLTHALDTVPHTGAMRYQEGIDRIPAVGISTVDAYKLSQALKSGEDVTVDLELECTAFPDVIQHNVIAEIKGSETPDEYIIVGGHLDSWDIGEGAHDDGAGIVQSIEVLRTLIALDYKPKRTIRVVLFVNEENGNNGGKTYAAVAQEKGEKHYAAIESDSGGFTPRGFSVEGGDKAYETVQGWIASMEKYGLHRVRRGWSGVDIRPLKNDYVTLFGLTPDNQRYFDYHHSKNDIWENVNKRELELGASAMTSLVYLIDINGL